MEQKNTSSAPITGAQEHGLVLAISSRALFNLEKENAIFETRGLEAYKKYQQQNEKRVLPQGGAFYLVEALLRLNKRYKKPLVQVLLVSRNSYETAIRIFNSVEEYGLEISRGAFLSGGSIVKYLPAFAVDLFLSKDQQAVQQALKSGFAAGLIYDLPKEHGPLKKTSAVQEMEIRLAFDGDGVIFSDEAQRIYDRKGLAAFQAHEKQHANRPLPKGPFAEFLKKLSQLQEQLEKPAPIKMALITARNSPSHERVVRTLREYQLSIDETFFLGGLPKEKVLKAFKPHIFFDDQKIHLESKNTGRAHTPAAQVPPTPTA